MLAVFCYLQMLIGCEKIYFQVISKDFFSEKIKKISADQNIILNMEPAGMLKSEKIKKNLWMMFCSNNSKIL